MSPWNHQDQAPTLSNLRPGQSAAVVDVAPNLPMCLRLQELGLVPGSEVEVLSGGSSLIVKVGDHRLTLRQEQAKGIRVVPL
jgi:Fe2+ transport system protein FeoA